MSIWDVERQLGRNFEQIVAWCRELDQRVIRSLRLRLREIFRLRLEEREEAERWLRLNPAGAGGNVGHSQGDDGRGDRHCYDVDHRFDTSAVDADHLIGGGDLRSAHTADESARRRPRLGGASPGPGPSLNPTSNFSPNPTTSVSHDPNATTGVAVSATVGVGANDTNPWADLPPRPASDSPSPALSSGRASPTIRVASPQLRSAASRRPPELLIPDPVQLPGVAATAASSRPPKQVSLLSAALDEYGLGDSDSAEDNPVGTHSTLAGVPGDWGAPPMMLTSAGAEDSFLGPTSRPRFASYSQSLARRPPRVPLHPLHPQAPPPLQSPHVHPHGHAPVQATQAHMTTPRHRRVHSQTSPGLAGAAGGHGGPWGDPSLPAAAAAALGTANPGGAAGGGDPMRNHRYLNHHTHHQQFSVGPGTATGASYARSDAFPGWPGSSLFPSAMGAHQPGAAASVAAAEEFFFAELHNHVEQLLADPTHPLGMVCSNCLSRFLNSLESFALLLSLRLHVFSLRQFSATVQRLLIRALFQDPSMPQNQVAPLLPRIRATVDAALEARLLHPLHHAFAHWYEMVFVAQDRSVRDKLQRLALARWRFDSAEWSWAGAPSSGASAAGTTAASAPTSASMSTAAQAPPVQADALPHAQLQAPAQHQASQPQQQTQPLQQLHLQPPQPRLPPNQSHAPQGAGSTCSAHSGSQHSGVSTEPYLVEGGAGDVDSVQERRGRDLVFRDACGALEEIPDLLTPREKIRALLHVCEQLRRLQPRGASSAPPNNQQRHQQHHQLNTPNQSNPAHPGRQQPQLEPHQCHRDTESSAAPAPEPLRRRPRGARIPDLFPDYLPLLMAFALVRAQVRHILTQCHLMMDFLGDEAASLNSPGHQAVRVLSRALAIVAALDVGQLRLQQQRQQELLLQQQQLASPGGAAAALRYLQPHQQQQQLILMHQAERQPQSPVRSALGFIRSSNAEAAAQQMDLSAKSPIDVRHLSLGALAQLQRSTPDWVLRELERRLAEGLEDLRRCSGASSADDGWRMLFTHHRLQVYVRKADDWDTPASGGSSSSSASSASASSSASMHGMTEDSFGGPPEGTGRIVVKAVAVIPASPVAIANVLENPVLRQRLAERAEQHSKKSPSGGAASRGFRYGFGGGSGSARNPAGSSKSSSSSSTTTTTTEIPGAGGPLFRDLRRLKVLDDNTRLMQFEFQSSRFFSSVRRRFFTLQHRSVDASDEDFQRSIYVVDVGLDRELAARVEALPSLQRLVDVSGQHHELQAQEADREAEIAWEAAEEAEEELRRSIRQQEEERARRPEFYLLPDEDEDNGDGSHSAGYRQSREDSGDSGHGHPHSVTGHTMNRRRSASLIRVSPIKVVNSPIKVMTSPRGGSHRLSPGLGRARPARLRFGSTSADDSDTARSTHSQSRSQSHSHSRGRSHDSALSDSSSSSGTSSHGSVSSSESGSGSETGSESESDSGSGSSSSSSDCSDDTRGDRVDDEDDRDLGDPAVGEEENVKGREEGDEQKEQGQGSKVPVSPLPASAAVANSDEIVSHAFETKKDSEDGVLSLSAFLGDTDAVSVTGGGDTNGESDFVSASTAASTGVSRDTPANAESPVGQVPGVSGGAAAESNSGQTASPRSAQRAVDCVAEAPVGGEDSVIAMPSPTSQSQQSQSSQSQQPQPQEDAQPALGGIAKRLLARVRLNWPTLRREAQPAAGDSPAGSADSPDPDQRQQQQHESQSRVASASGGSASSEPSDRRDISPMQLPGPDPVVIPDSGSAFPSSASSNSVLAPDPAAPPVLGRSPSVAAVSVSASPSATGSLSRKFGSFFERSSSLGGGSNAAVNGSHHSPQSSSVAASSGTHPASPGPSAPVSPSSVVAGPLSPGSAASASIHGGVGGAHSGGNSSGAGGLVTMQTPENQLGEIRTLGFVIRPLNSAAALSSGDLNQLFLDEDGQDLLYTPASRSSRAYSTSSAAGGGGGGSRLSAGGAGSGTANSGYHLHGPGVTNGASGTVGGALPNNGESPDTDPALLADGIGEDAHPAGRHRTYSASFSGGSSASGHTPAAAAAAAATFRLRHTARPLTQVVYVLRMDLRGQVPSWARKVLQQRQINLLVQLGRHFEREARAQERQEQQLKKAAASASASVSALAPPGTQTQIHPHQAQAQTQTVGLAGSPSASRNGRDSAVGCSDNGSRTSAAAAAAQPRVSANHGGNAAAAAAVPVEPGEQPGLVGGVAPAPELRSDLRLLASHDDPSQI